MADDRKTKSVGFLFFIVHNVVCMFSCDLKKIKNMIEKEEYLKAKKIVAEYEKQLNIHSVSKTFTPLIGEIVEVLYSEDNFNVGDKVEVYERHEEEDFWVVGNDDPNSYNESIHISDLKRIN